MMLPMTDAEVDASARAYYEAEYNYRAEECEAMERAAREVRAMRGRWLVVHEDGGALRFRGRQGARGYSRACRYFGIPSRVIRYRRDRVQFDEALPGLMVSDPRLWP